MNTDVAQCENDLLPRTDRSVPDRPDETALGVVPPPPGVTDFRRTSIERMPEIPGYRLTRRIGQGGMGTVFEAMQLELNRPVALKILPSVWFGQPEMSERFRLEATVLARLQHPNIVQIFEVGDAYGQPYLALELMSDKTLADQLRDKPLGGNDAAGLVESLARTMQYAHDQGVLHRDLKPANVLLPLTVSNELQQKSTQPVTKIGDFGLAKLLDRPGLTRTGETMGTPCYMAPEQASGGANVGPATDIYALGAVLYECLTGRPPFLAATTLQTLEQVQNFEPLAPGKVQPGLARDLETICLKCLEKDPARRYGSARQLAEDLRRFLDGQPVLARPVGPATRVIKWSRRKPALAGLILVSLFAAMLGLVGLLAHQAETRAALARISAEKDRADTNYREARNAFRQILARFEDRRYAVVPRAIELRNAQYEDALRFFTLVIGREDDPDPEVRLDVARTRVEVAKLQRTLGRKESQDNVRAALDLYTGLVASDSNRPEFEAGRAECLYLLGHWLTTAGDYSAVSLLEEAGAAYDRLLVADPGNLGYRVGQAGTIGALGAMHWNRKDFNNAKVFFHREEKRRADLARDDPMARNHAASLARVQVNLSLCYQQTGPDAETENYFRRASATFEVLLRDDGRDVAAAIGLAALRLNWAYQLDAKGQAEAALAGLRKNLELLEPLHRLEPELAEYKVTLKNTHGVMAVIHDRQHRYTEAAKSYERVVEFTTLEQRPVHQAELAKLYALSGDHARASVLVEAITANPDGVRAETIHYLGQALGIAARVARNDPKLSDEKRTNVADQYARQAARLFERARQALGNDAWQPRRKDLLKTELVRPILDHPEVQAALRE